MRLPLLLAGILGLAGCTISPMTVNIVDTKDGETVTWEKSSLDPTGLIDKVIEGETVEEPMPTMVKPPLPKLPNFTDEELTQPEVIEQRLVQHIHQLRQHITTFYGDVDKFVREHNES